MKKSNLEHRPWVALHIRRGKWLAHFKGHMSMR